MDWIFLADDWSTIETQGRVMAQSVDNLCWWLAALFGLIGGLRIYNKWQLHSHHRFHVDAEIALWLLGCIFFIIAHVVTWVLFPA